MWVGKGFLWLTGHCPPSKEVRVGTEAEARSAANWLFYRPCSAWFPIQLSALGSTAHSGLGPPISIINQENAP